MATPGLPRILQKQVERLSDTTACNSTDIFLAAKVLLPLARGTDDEAMILLSLQLERVVMTAVAFERTAYDVASDMDTVARTSKLKPYVIMTRRLKFSLWLLRIKHSIKTLFGLIPWIDYRTRNWFKVK